MKNTHPKKIIGIWLDHTKAFLQIVEPDIEGIQTIFSGIEEQERFYGEGSDGTRFGQYGSNNENRKEHREQHFMNIYYKKLEQNLEPFDEILLFGPAEAKLELKNLLESNSHFRTKHIYVQTTEEMPEAADETLCKRNILTWPFKRLNQYQQNNFAQGLGYNTWSLRHLNRSPGYNGYSAGYLPRRK